MYAGRNAGHQHHPGAGDSLAHRQSGLGPRHRQHHRDARARQSGRRGRLVGRSVLGLQQGRAGVQRGLAGVRPKRSEAADWKPTSIWVRRLPGWDSERRSGRRAQARRTGGRADGSDGMLAGLLTTGGLATGSAQTIAITGGTIYPVSGPKIENGTLLLRDGKIAAVGASIEIPSGATRVDAKGGWITPGLIHGGSTLGSSCSTSGSRSRPRRTPSAAT